MSGNSSIDGSNNKDLAKLTVAELREECRRHGLRNVSKLKKDELISLLRGKLARMTYARPRCQAATWCVGPRHV